MKIEAKILSGDKTDLEKELNKFLNKGYKLKGGLIHDEGNYFHALIIKKVK